VRLAVIKALGSLNRESDLVALVQALHSQPDNLGHFAANVVCVFAAQDCAFALAIIREGLKILDSATDGCLTQERRKPARKCDQSQRQEKKHPAESGYTAEVMAGLH
jgi:hypothetical protein